jgi:putative tricarboxylic transport membrane protein
MKVNDAVWGALLMLLGIGLLVHVQSFPTIPGQRYGPGLFPGVIGVGLALCAALLIVKGVAARARGRERAQWVAFEPWARSPRHVLAFSLTLLVNVFYIVAVGPLGFIPTGILYLATLFAVFGVRARWILPLALVSTLVIHTVFYKLLRVPLPWGLLEPVLW